MRFFKRDSRRRERGDTIIEVLFATAALSLVIVISFSIMNRGIATAQLAVENTFVRQNIDGQAEALRFLRDAYVNNRTPSGNVKTQWERIVNTLTVDRASTFGDCDPNSRAFYINTNTATVSTDIQPAVTFAGAEFGQGLWIEAVRPSVPPGNPQYIDFHIRACWEPTTSGPTVTTGTIVRLYVVN